MERVELRVMGGLYEAEAPMLVARSSAEVLDAFRRVSLEQAKVTLAGAKRSFGRQFLPPQGGYLLDVGELDRGAQIIETCEDGSVWIRAGGGMRFCDLRSAFPRHRTVQPPTTDTITLAGALAACTHASGGYFADSVRAFSLICPNGSVYWCHDNAGDLEQRLFRHAVGAFGALGAITDIELRLTPIDPAQKVCLQAIFAGPIQSEAYLDTLEAVRDDARFAEGCGAIVYGNQDYAIVLGDELLQPEDKRPGKVALLTDDSVRTQAALQALVNRFPGLSAWLVKRAYGGGSQMLAPWYGFQFFQRGYDKAHALMAANGLPALALRLLGARHRLPLCHSGWFFPRSELRSMMRGYFRILSRYPGLERLAELQDIVLLGPSNWPCHSMGQTSEPVGVLSVSFAVERDGSSQREVALFLDEVTNECDSFAKGARVSLCKQMYGSPETIRRVYAPYVERLIELKSQVDPQGLLSSEFLLALGLG